MYQHIPVLIVLEGVVVKNKMNAFKGFTFRKTMTVNRTYGNDNDEFTFKNTMVVDNRKDGSKLLEKTCDSPKDQMDSNTKESFWVSRLTVTVVSRTGKKLLRLQWFREKERSF